MIIIKEKNEIFMEYACAQKHVSCEKWYTYEGFSAYTVRQKYLDTL